MTAVLDVLAHGRQQVDPALRAALERLDPANRALAYYHLGWTDLDGNPTTTSGGKAVRPALALLSAKAAGASSEVGLPGAVAVELVHNFSLLHDDLMDGDTERRHRPTVWFARGAASAILTGDAMLALAQEVLLESGPTALQAARLLANATNKLIKGETLDVAFEQRDDVSLDECLTMSAGKTGALLAASASIGAVLAGAPSTLVDALSAFGMDLGLAFQFVDDVLGIWGDPEVTGKPVYSDLRAGKKTLPVCYAIIHGGAAGAELASRLLADGRSSVAELRDMADLVEFAGGRSWAVAEADRRMIAAQRALGEATIPERPREELSRIARFIVTRQA